MRLVGVMALALLAWLALPVASQAAEKGLVTDMVWGTSSRDVDRTTSLMTDVGAKWVRLNVSWSDAERSRGSYNNTELSEWDYAVSKARAAGTQVLMTIDTSPGWASGSSNRDAPPRNPDDFASFASFLANRYRGQVQYYEIWNEENTPRFWAPWPDPAAYAGMLKAAAPAIRSADPNAKVVFGGVSLNDYNFLQGVYNAAPDIGSYFDIMATHPYPAGGGSPLNYWYEGSRISAAAFAGYREVRSTLLAHGDDKPIWFTEIGWSTTSAQNGVSLSTQAQYLTLAYQCVEQDPYVQVAFWYNFRNNYWARDADDWEDQLGLMWTNYSQKPAYSAFKSYSPGAGGCAYRNVAAPPDASATAGASSPPPVSLPASPQSTLTRVRIRPGSRARASSTKAGRERRVVLRRFTVLGNVAPADKGQVLLRLQRGVNGRWHDALRLTTTVGRLGAFRKTLSSRRLGRWRVRAFYQGASGLKPSSSPFVPFRI